ncbi:gamma-crystallin M2-like [Brachyhypopomus gauderio]|uniref:gamma-crystallin M2-like n=1 Tax=Brachyhypopomus gauderio TaxID=698409 RepID=UPI00404187A2
MGKIVFYEDRNFSGRSHEWSGDCPDTSPFLSRCHSCRVESGCWMVYDRSDYTGGRHFLRRGEYADCMGLWGWSSWPRSCRMIPVYRGNYRMRVYDKENFTGQMMEVTDDCESFTDRYHWSGGCGSCHVMDGHWLMYEHPHYRGKMWYFGPGEYRNFREMMGTGSTRFMSMRRIMDSWH